MAAGRTAAVPGLSVRGGVKKGRRVGGRGWSRGRLKLVMKIIGLQVGKNWLTGLRDAVVPGNPAVHSYKLSTRQHNMGSALQLSYKLSRT